MTARRAAADFHETVISLADNELLNELERTLRSRMRWLLAQHDDLMAMAKEHEALYAALADRDVARVEELVTKRWRAVAARRRPPGTPGAGPAEG
ncbi:FCD domain-containing protein [Streptomyces albulus]|nr:FCD domain-containing protein [Streptomyces noursei]